MKKICFLFAAVLFASVVNATVWRVNPHVEAAPDFNSLDSALMSTLVQDHDTLYLEPGMYGDVDTRNIRYTISRPLTLMGSGWGFNANNGAIDKSAVAEIACDYLILDADSISLIGLYIHAGVTNDSRKDNIRIEHCYLVYGCSCKTTNLVFRENLCLSNLSVSNNSTVTRNALVENNIFVGDLQSFDFRSEQNFTSVFQHNTLIDTRGCSYVDLNYWNNCIFKDNLCLYSGSTFTDVITWVLLADCTVQFHNNVFAADTTTYNALTAEQKAKLPADNIFAGATIENTFVNTVDGMQDEAARYMLLSSSAAVKAASDGTDCGAFGGTNPYTLNGRPEGVPYIYDVTVPSEPVNDSLTITFHVATN